MMFHSPCQRFCLMMAEGHGSFNSVYHSLESIIKFLKTSQFSQTQQVQNLINVFEEKYDQDAQVSTQHLHPFIVVEGLDGSGKTCITKKLKAKLRGELVSTPPACLLGMRGWFDEQPKELRRAYYSLGNYIVGKEVEKMVDKCPVVMDRFWHSTAAYAIADEVRDKKVSLPEAGDKLYEWPTDLSKPDIVLFLNVSEEVRLQRLSSRTANTAEEQQLAADREWRSNVVEVHKRIANVKFRLVNGNPFPNKVIRSIEEMLQEL